MSSKQVLLGLVPWLLYAVLTIAEGEWAGLYAAAAAAGWALVALLLSVSRGASTKILDVSALVIFGAFALIEVLGGADARDVLDDQGRGLAAALLAAMMLVSVAVRPFTEQYSRSDVPTTYRSSPVFRAVHRDLSLRWGLTVAVAAISYLIEADVRAADGSAVLAFVLTWVVPIGAVAVAARQSKVSKVGRRAADAVSGTWPEANTRFFRSGTP